ncbi:MAG: ROK family protein [Bacteroidota bacterium]|nr:ROK family protein [Bacteroidota bacterium]
MERIIGIDIGGTKISMGKIADNKLLTELNFPTNAARPKEEIIEDIINGIGKLNDPDVVGIGIGVPGLVDEKDGIIYDLTNIPSWKEVHLKKHIEDAFEKPVRVSNDANCFALGEKVFGKGEKYKNLVGITLGTGVGAGIIVNGELCTGKLSIAGEFASIPYKDRNYEFYCSGKFFVENYGLTGKEVHDRALSGDIKAIRILDEYGENLGDLIKTILLVLGPEAIILGGSGAKSFRFFQKAMMESIRQFPFKRIIKNLAIEVSKNEKIALFGAAALIYSDLAFQNKKTTV